MLHVDWESKANQKALPEILARRQLRGGRIVVFQRVVSFIFFTRLSNHYCLVSPDESRRLRGFIFFLPSFLTGWWSPSGFLHTCFALSHNVLGGIDVTEQVDNPARPSDPRSGRTFTQKRFALCIALIIVFLLPIFAWFALVVIK
jgi:hypothetical protein